MLYSVRSWALPKRRQGSYWKGYISSVIDAASPEKAAERMVQINREVHPHIVGQRRAIEVKDNFSGAVWMYEDDGQGAPTSRKRGSHGPFPFCLKPY